MTNQIHIEIYVSQIVGMAQKAEYNYENKMISDHLDHLAKVRHYNKNRSWADKFLCSEMHEMTFKEFCGWYSDKGFLEFIEYLINLTRSKGTTVEKVKLSIDLDKWDMLTKYYGGFNE